MPPVFGVLFDGLAYGTLLFLLSVGLSVTLGMMNFVNLAHCSFAMLGGYVTVTLMNRLGWPFFATLPAAFVAAAAASVVLERAFFRRFYNASDLEQCLLTIGIVFVSIAAAAYIYGTDQQPVQLPAFLRGSIAFAGLNFAVYRLFLIGIALIITVVLVATLEMTRFGAQVRAAVNNQRMARGLGIDVDALFAITFALGSGLAGLGGALAIDLVGLDPSFAFTYLIYVLIVVSVGGLGSIGGSLAAAMLLGVSDIAGKYYVPALGSILIYSVMTVLIMLRPPGVSGDASVTSTTIAKRAIICRHRCAGAWAKCLWLATLLPSSLRSTISCWRAKSPSPRYWCCRLILSSASPASCRWSTPLFRHCAYSAGLTSKLGWGEPLTGGLVIAALAAGLFGYVTSFMIADPPPATDYDDARHRLVAAGIGEQCEVAHRRFRRPPRHPYLADSRADSVSISTATPHTATRSLLVVIFLGARRLIHSPFGLALRGIRDNSQRMRRSAQRSIRISALSIRSRQ